MGDQQQKITIPMRKRFDKLKRPFYVGRPKLPVSLQLDRFIALVFPFAGDRSKGIEEGAELVFELAHEDSTYKNASRTLKRLALKIRNEEERKVVLGFLNSVLGDSPHSEDDDGKGQFMSEFFPGNSGNGK